MQINLSEEQVEQLVKDALETDAIMSFNCFNYGNFIQVTGTMFSNEAPSEGETFELEGGYILSVELSIDDTDTEDSEQGLSYNKIKFNINVAETNLV